LVLHGAPSAAFVPQALGIAARDQPTLVVTCAVLHYRCPLLFLLLLLPEMIRLHSWCFPSELVVGNFNFDAFRYFFFSGAEQAEPSSPSYYYGKFFVQNS